MNRLIVLFALLLTGCSAARTPVQLSTPDPADASAASTPVTPLPSLLEGEPARPAAAGPAEEDHSGHHSAAPAADHQHPEPEPAVVYTCPMHPDVRQAEPGTCSICGMKLIPHEKPPHHTP